MADTPNPAPAAAGSAPAQPDPMSILDMAGDDDAGARYSSPAADEGEDTESEPVEIEGDPEPAAEGKPEDEEAGEDEGPEDDASEPEPEDKSDEDDDPDAVTVRLRDRSEVSLGDLKKGYARARELEQYIPQIQQERQRFEQERQAFAAQTQQLQPILAQVATILQGQIPPEPDLALLQNDPIEFHNQRYQREQALAKLNQVNQAHAQQMQAAQVENHRRMQAAVNGAVQQFFAARPELTTDKAKGEAFAKDFVTVAERVGFQKGDLGQITDPRLYELGRLAILGMQKEQADAQAKQVKTQKAAVAAKKVADKPPVTPPAARQPQSVRQGAVARSSLDKLRRTGSARDAEDFLSRFE